MKAWMIPVILALLKAVKCDHQVELDNALFHPTKSASVRYTPDWESLDQRPLPTWYDEVKFGIFLHWGVFSVPSFGEWFWYNWYYKEPSYVDFMDKNFPPNFTYAAFAARFQAEFFDPNHWAEVFKASGAKYVVLTSKHHEGYTLWPSKYSFNWNSMDVGPARDLVGDLAKAIRSKTDIKFGVYHSLYEWFNPLYLKDKASNFTQQDFVRLKTMPELYELVNTYKPEVIWSDGDWEASENYWNTTNFLAWLYNDSPVKDSVVVNDRWGAEVLCKHGDYLTCSDRFNPDQLPPKKWENAMTIDKKAWAYRRNARLEDFLTVQELLETLAKTVSFGGNLLMNVGPSADGLIHPIFEERLLQIGLWLKINGESIYGTKPWLYQQEAFNPTLWYTSKVNGANVDVYAIFFAWPSHGKLKLTRPKTSTSTVITALGYNKTLEWSQGPLTLQIALPPRAAMVSEWGWVVKMTTLKNAALSPSFSPSREQRD